MIIRHGVWWDRFWGMIPKVLPTVYDDSLSYYEVLNKLIKATGELAGAVDDVLDEVADYTEDAQQAAETAETSAQSAQTAAQEASMVSASTFSMPILYDDETPRAEVLYSHEPDIPSDALIGIKVGKLGIVHAYLNVNLIESGYTSFIGYPRMYVGGELKEFYFSTLIGNVVYTSDGDYCEVMHGSDHEGYTLYNREVLSVGGTIELLLIGVLSERS